jgi:hypothetical protein
MSCETVRVRSLISRRDIYFRAAPECGSQLLRMSPHPDRKRKESHGVGVPILELDCRMYVDCKVWVVHMFAVALTSECLVIPRTLVFIDGLSTVVCPRD